MKRCPELALTLGQFASRYPHSIAVFERHGLDYCCGGHRTLAAACAAAGLDSEETLNEILAVPHPTDHEKDIDWLGASMSELADHIERTHHTFVRDALARLEALVPRVVAVHSDSEPRLFQLGETVRAFSDAMHDHMVREERVLFPWIRRLEKHSELQSGPPWSVRRPISCMVHDHDEAGAALAAMRALTDGFAAPTGACASYRSMLDLLSALERDTHVHIHKENNILFPAGIRAEDRLNATSRMRRSAGIGDASPHGAVACR